MNATTQPVAPEEVMAFLDGELSADRAQSVSAHISECTECHDMVASLSKTSRSLTAWTVPTSQPHLGDDVATASTKTLASLSAAGFGTLPPRGWSWQRWALTSTTAGCAFLVLLWISTPNLLRSKMAANESASIGRQRAAETARNTPVNIAEATSSQTNDKANSDVEASRDPFREHGRNPISRGDAGDSQYYVRRIPFPGQPGSASPQTETVSPMIARTVSLSLVVKDFDVGRASLDAILTRHNGYAANLSVSTPQGTARVIQASLRIPTPQLAAAIGELKALGRVEAETQNGEEVTQQHADLVARIKNDRETEIRLQDILRTRTGKVKDVLDVEQEIARVQGEIEQMEAEQKTLEHRVAFATIDLKLAEEYKAQLNTPAPSVLMQLRNATVNGFRNAFESLLALVLFLAESGPSLVLWLALLGIPAWRLWRRYRRAQSLGSLAGA